MIELNQVTEFENHLRDRLIRTPSITSSRADYVKTVRPFRTKMRSVLNWGPAIKRIALSTNWTRPAFLYCKLNGTEQAIRSTVGYYMTGKMAARSFTLCLLLFVIGLKITREMQTASGMTNTALSSACTNALWVLPRCLDDLLLFFEWWK